MKNKIVLFNVIILTLSMLVLFFFGITVNQSLHQEEAEKEIVDIANIYAANFNDKITDNVPDGIRITVVDSNFSVLADSEDSSIVGTYHTNREELESALEGNPKIVTRYSSTLQKNMVYYAVKVERDDGYVFVRAAIPVEGVNAYAEKTVANMLYVLAVAWVVSFVASVVATNSIVKPIKDVEQSLSLVKSGKFKRISPSSSDKEINDIIAEINDIGETLEKSIRVENEDRKKLDYILSNVTDGIVVLDENKNVDVMNIVATEIFGVKNAVGKSLSALVLNEDFDCKLKECFDGSEKSSFEFSSDGKYYLVSVKSLENGFAVIALSDITAVKNGEKMRSEFFANASHELKTPLTAIKGFNDIVSLETQEEKTKMLSAKIDKELSRIVSLINDMLNISKLEVKNELSPENVNLKAVATEVCDSLSLLAEKKNVSVELCGDGSVFMEKEHAVELIKNLVENGIRYNSANGHVKVEIEQKDKAVELTVSDDGIGIEEEHQARIFERFYRVDKSRSRETGSTGLGLSIVKHICSLYDATLELKSKFGVGTTVKVTFKK